MIAPAFPRVTWIVLDSVGAGEMPDAAAYGDAGSDTLGHIARARELHLPNMAQLGLGNLKELPHVGPVERPTAAFGRCACGPASSPRLRFPPLEILAQRQLQPVLPRIRGGLFVFVRLFRHRGPVRMHLPHAAAYPMARPCRHAVISI